LNAALRHIRRQPQARSWRWLLLPLMLWLGCGPAANAVASSLVYKNYIIRYDRGWDILCEPYVVQKDDWVLKIFRQKGEISHQDFRDFMGIFQRLNPHIKNIDMIRPGQSIDIPLRKVEHGTFTDQASGVVTIPFVNLTQVSDVIKAHSQTYQIQRGDTVSKLLAAKYGAFGSRSYQEGVKLFQAANPQVTNLDLIYAGQKVYLPDPEIREQSFYNAMYDAQGNLREAIRQNSAAAPPPPVSKAPAALPVPVPAVPAPQREEASSSTLQQAAATVGGQLRDRGTYYLPRPNQEDFEMDLSRHPLLEFQDGTKMTFTPDDRIMGMKKEEFRATWPDIKTVTIEPQASTQQVVGAIFQALDQDREPTDEVTFESQGVRVTVHAEWVRPENEGRHLCITPISGPEQQTPEAIRRFLDQNGVVLKELLPGGGSAPLENAPERHAVSNILALAPTGQRDFVQALARSLGFTYTAGSAITFPYAGIQIQAYADLLSAGNGRETLVDFGDLYGDAVAAITKTGLNIVQITADDSYSAIVQKLFGALGLAYESQPTFLAANRPSRYNTVLAVNGLLYAKPDGHRILLTGAALPSAVSDLLSDQGIDVIIW
jgi:LysM repeat protein